MKLVYLCFFFLFIVASYIFKTFQDKNKMGGKIAFSKSLWLSYTIFTWFTLPVLFQLDQFLSGDFKFVTLTFSASMWIRGVIELILLFEFKAWKPKYGIIHNLFTMALLIGSTYTFSSLHNLEWWFITALTLGLTLETYYAVFFHKQVGVKTQGDEPIWFANKHEKKYKTNLLITIFGNIILYSLNIVFILKLD